MGKEKVSKEKPLASSACSTGDAAPLGHAGEGENDMGADGKWHGAPADNPNIQYYSWGFGGVAPKTAPDAASSATTASFGSTFSSPEEKVEDDWGTEILRLPLAERPVCPYERAEYNAAVTDALQRVGRSRMNAYGRHVAHMLALAQVMMGRAGLALRESQMTESMEVRSDNYNMTTSKVSAALTAYQILERSWRRQVADFERRYCAIDRRADEEVYQLRTESDLDPDFLMGDHESIFQYGVGADATPPEDIVVEWDREDEDEAGGTRSRASADEEDLVPPGVEDDAAEDEWVELGNGKRFSA